MIQTGCQGPIVQHPEYEYDAGQGTRVIYPWIGTHAEIDALVFSLTASGLYSSVRKVSISDMQARCLATQQGVGEESTTASEITWELLPNASEKDIFEHPLFENTANFPAESYPIDSIKLALDGSDDSFGREQLTTYEQEVYDLIRKGVKGTKSSAPVIQKTTTVANAYSQVIAETNVEKVIPHAILRDIETSIPYDFRIPFADSGSLPAAMTGFTIGWFKNRPTTTRRTRFNYDIQQQWEFGVWPDLLYEIVS